jgi:hypothetical protein
LGTYEAELPKQHAWVHQRSSVADDVEQWSEGLLIDAAALGLIRNPNFPELSAQCGEARTAPQQAHPILGPAAP